MGGQPVSSAARQDVQTRNTPDRDQPHPQDGADEHRKGHQRQADAEAGELFHLLAIEKERQADH